MQVKSLEVVAEENRSLEHSNQSLEQQLSSGAHASVSSLLTLDKARNALAYPRTQRNLQGQESCNLKW